MKAARRNAFVQADKVMCLLAGLVVALVGGTATAEVDLSGVWTIRLHEEEPERGPGADFGEYMGLPINDEARQLALSWHPSLHNVPEHQCEQLRADYNMRWSNQRIWKEVDPLTQEIIAWHIVKAYHNAHRIIWMDGRPHPPEYGPHTFNGFSTGRWEDDKLVVRTTHMKSGVVIRNGVPRSDQGEMIEHYLRHGGHLSIVQIVQDPVYLTEPVVYSSDYVLDLEADIEPYPCEVVTELPSRGRREVPHFLPWANPYLEEAAAKRGFPLETWLGGAHTMYPDFIE